MNQAYIRPPLEISIVVPTFNEKGNVEKLIDGVKSALQGVSWELIFVDDDSPDGTANIIWKVSNVDARVRCLRRVGRRGLSSACVEGMLSTGAPLMAVMDADLQHDPALLMVMLEKMRRGNADIILASRYITGGGVGEWDQGRLRISQFATRLAKMITKQDISDPMSGFFMIRRNSFEQALPTLSAIGFKILLDLVASSPKGLRVEEVPFLFGQRLHGESKLSAKVAWDFGLMLIEKFFGRLIPARFISFGIVGGIGSLLHLSILAVVFKGLNFSFSTGQAIGVTITMVFNYTFNNLITYSDRTLRGFDWYKGLLSFTLICLIGMIANVGMATFLYDHQTHWGGAALAGILVGSVWNFVVTSKFTWRS
jgi:dolichol-phosphate mannosyltransferase